MKLKLVILFIFIGICVVIGNFFYVSEKPKVIASTPLIGQLKSLMNPVEVKEVIKVANIIVVEDSGLVKDDKRPKFNVLIWKIEAFDDLGMNGELTVVFFNGQLLRTRFYPEDYNAYEKKISIFLKTNFEEGKTTEITPKTDLLFNKDIEGKYYFEWSDRELQIQFDEWISDNA